MRVPFRPKAITLMELMVVMAMIGIFLTVGYGGITAARDRAYLKEGVNWTVDLLQEARTKATANLRVDTGTQECEADAFYVLFDTLPGPVTLSLKADLTTDCGDAAYVLRTKTLRSDLILTTAPTNNNFTVRFLTPNAAVEIVPAQTVPVTATLQTAGGLSRSIEISNITGIPELQ